MLREIEQSGHLTLVDPPRLLQTMEITQPGEVWKICESTLWISRESHIIGASTATRLYWAFLWGETDRFWLEETKEKNLWKICCQPVAETQSEVAGFVGIYVDDVLVAASTSTASGFLKCLRNTWECSEPEWVTSTSTKKMRFCGYEIGSLPQGGFFLFHNHPTSRTF